MSRRSAASARQPSTELQEALGYQFRDTDLLSEALTHPSYRHERSRQKSPPGDYERLEFLGDAVLEFCVRKIIFDTHSDWREGEMDRLKASLVNSESLALKARQLRLGKALLLGAGEAQSGGRDKQSILENAFEAVVAAVYLDGGLRPAQALIRRLFGPQIRGADLGRPKVDDPKSLLQQALQARGLPLPVYRVTGESGPEHRKIFAIELVIDGVVFANVRAAAKKKGEQKAASKALEIIQDWGDWDIAYWQKWKAEQPRSKHA